MPIDEIIKLRHELHQHPEISNQEHGTAERIVRYFSALSPDQVISLGKTGKAFLFNGKEPGKTLMFRAELDALPIQEACCLPYASTNSGVGHLCGHDGHMAILAGLAKKIASDRPDKGRVIFLYQPAEEVEQGARDVVEDPNFKAIEPDYIFALHNIPGIHKQAIVLREGSFASASKGMTTKLFGKTSHAAEPENGISPATAISRIIHDLQELVDQKEHFRALTLLTIIHIRLGEISFGTTPGYAEIRCTLRAFENTDMDELTDQAMKIIREIASEEKLKTEIDFSEIFPATVNNAQCHQIIQDSANQLGLEIVQKDEPYKWSEDFAYFTQKYPGGMFGLGSGTEQPQLHNPNYDFPDDILETGIAMFYQIYKNIQSELA